MKHLFLLAPLLAAAAAGFRSGGESIVYAPAEGQRLARTFDSKGEYSLREIAIEVDGEEVGPEDAPSVEIASTEHIAVTDEIAAIAAGRPTRIERTFDELSQGAVLSSPGADESTELAYASELEEATVVIAWDEEEETYAFSAAEDEEIDEELLAHLAEDMDLRLFLPPGEVEEGATWPLSAAAYRSLAWPGGNLQFIAEGEEQDADELALDLALAAALEGEGEATYAGVREEDGLRLAAISFTFELEAAVEREVEAEAEAVRSLVSGRETTREVEGELLWDLEHGHLHSLTATDESEFVFAETVSLDFGEESHVQKQRRTFTGTSTLTVTVERE
ncbi:MAG: hypothetical protein AB1726_14255 [Planctomycetota bacterium]